MHYSELQFAQHWESRVSAVCDSLERDDLRYILVYNSWQDVYEQMVRAQGDSTHKAASHEFAMLMSVLKNLRLFVGNLSIHGSPNLETSIFWGLLGLIMKVSSFTLSWQSIVEADRHEPALPR